MLSNKVLVEIFVPAIGKTFDAYLPLDCKAGVATQLAAASLSSLSNETFIASSDSILCDAASGVIYNANKKIKELEIKNGGKLLLI